MNVSVECGRCRGDIYFHACPEHHWAVLGVCRGCLATNIEHSGRCLECDFSVCDVAPDLEEEVQE
jgi:hypothetical protein